MYLLPAKNLLKKLVITSFLFVSALFVSASASLAASAYISPATGFIKEPSFLVSVYVETTSSEPQIAGANINISYPTTVSVSAINEGDFDSYIEKSFDDTTRIIKVNAVNNAGNYKSGKVKLASIQFNTTASTGQVQLVIRNDSGISGEGGQQLLTDTINGVYTIDIPANAGTGSGTGTGTGTTGGTGNTTGDENNQNLEMGGNDFLIFTFISVALIGLGIISLKKPGLTVKR